VSIGRTDVLDHRRSGGQENSFFQKNAKERKERKEKKRLLTF
jgi:hypothetical protein